MPNGPVFYLLPVGVSIPLEVSDEMEETLMEGPMGCPHLVASDKPACKSVNLGTKEFEMPYAPSRFQLMEYCLKIKHRQCPFYSLSPADLNIVP